jgi:hypothetical protein
VPSAFVVLVYDAVDFCKPFFRAETPCNHDVVLPSDKTITAALRAENAAARSSIDKSGAILGSFAISSVQQLHASASQVAHWAELRKIIC